MSINLQTALKALLQNKLQALLTLLGMSVGVAMVVIVCGLGRGAQVTIEEQLQRAGPTLIVIRSGNFKPAAQATRGQQDNSGGEMSESGAQTSAAPEGTFDVSAQSQALARAPVRRMQMVRTRTPATPLGDAEMHLLEHDIDDVRAVAGSVDGNVSVDADDPGASRVVHVHGFGAAWPDMHNWHLAAGRMITADEHAAGAAVALVTAAAAARLWP
ncbi:MAG: ABC transporter permease, partial [Solimonas sp.]